MRNYFINLFVLIGTFCSFSMAEEVELTIDGTSLNYVSTQDIYGFQFNHDGCASGSSGGDAGAAGFMISSSSTITLGFSLTGSFVAAGEGTLVDLGG